MPGSPERLAQLTERALAEFATTGHPLCLLRASHWSLLREDAAYSRQLLYQAAAALLTMGEERAEHSARSSYRKLDAGYGATRARTAILESVAQLSSSRCYVCTRTMPELCIGERAGLCSSCSRVAQTLIGRHAATAPNRLAAALGAQGRRADCCVCRRANVLVIASRLGAVCFDCVLGAEATDSPRNPWPSVDDSRGGLPVGVLGDVRILFDAQCGATVASFWRRRSRIRWWHLYVRPSGVNDFAPLSSIVVGRSGEEALNELLPDDSLECPLLEGGHLFFLRCRYHDLRGEFLGRTITAICRYELRTGAFSSASLPKVAWPIAAIIGASANGSLVYLSAGVTDAENALSYRVVELEWESLDIRVLAQLPSALLT